MNGELFWRSIILPHFVQRIYKSGEIQNIKLTPNKVHLDTVIVRLPFYYRRLKPLFSTYGRNQTAAETTFSVSAKTETTLKLRLVSALTETEIEATRPY